MGKIVEGILHEDMTEVVEPPTVSAVGWAFTRRLEQRLKGIDDFVESQASGTARKAGRVGASVASHGRHDRVAHEFGGPFVAIPETYATFGKARSEHDVPSLTEAWWYIERYASTVLFPGDVIQTRYITAEVDGVRREGVGIVVRKTSAPWIPKGYVVFAIIAEWDAVKGEFLPAVNPC